MSESEELSETQIATLVALGINPDQTSRLDLLKKILSQNAELMKLRPSRHKIGPQPRKRSNRP